MTDTRPVTVNIIKGAMAANDHSPRLPSHMSEGSGMNEMANDKVVNHGRRLWVKAVRDPDSVGIVPWV